MKICVPLLKSEQSLLKMRLPSVTAITFYKLDSDCYERIKENVQKRVDAIISVNPWLSGGLRSGKTDIELVFEEDGGSGIVVAGYENHGINTTLTAAAISRHPTLKETVVKKGISVLDASEPLMKVAMFFEGDTFALLLSINHIVADGSTFYQIYKMFDINEDLVPLIPERAHQFDPCFKGVVSGQSKWFDSNVHRIGTVSGVAQNLIKPGYPAILRVNNIAVKKAKKKARGFVSSNDVLCSWYFKKTQCDFGFMYVDFRGRIEGITELHAGNYSHEVLITNGEFENPHNMRMMVKEIVEGVRPPVCLPGMRETTRYNSSMITNWCKFFHQLEFMGATHLLHIPYFHVSQISVRHWRNVSTIFKPNTRDVAIISYTARNIDASEDEAALLQPFEMYEVSTGGGISPSIPTSHCPNTGNNVFPHIGGARAPGNVGGIDSCRDTCGFPSYVLVTPRDEGKVLLRGPSTGSTRDCLTEECDCEDKEEECHCEDKAEEGHCED